MAAVVPLPMGHGLRPCRLVAQEMGPAASGGRAAGRSAPRACSRACRETKRSGRHPDVRLLRDARAFLYRGRAAGARGHQLLVELPDRRPQRPRAAAGTVLADVAFSRRGRAAAPGGLESGLYGEARAGRPVLGPTHSAPLGGLPRAALRPALRPDALSYLDEPGV